MAGLLRIARRLQPSTFRRRDPNRHLSRRFQFDTLAMVRSLEQQGLPSKQAEAITSGMAQIFNANKESLVSKQEMENVEIVHETNISKIKSEFKSSQECHLTLFQSNIDKLKNELKFETETSFAGLKLQMREDNAELRLQMEALKVQVEATKSELIKYFIGSVVAMSGFALGVMRMMR